jgi:hypothetical protein
MAIKNGPGTVSSNLRFAWDIADTKNSYLGQPTTNLIQFSEQFNQSYWTKAQVSISPNVEYAPDGNQTADYMIENTANDTHQTYVFLTGMTTGIYTFSLYAKAGARTRVTMGLYEEVGTFSYQPWFDLVSGTIVQNTGGGTARIQSVGNGWYRCSITGNCTTGRFYPFFRLVQSGLTEGYAGDGVSGAYFWGAQLERTSQPTTYIPTTNSTSTRSSTNSLLDISGYNTPMDVSNMSYDSNSSICFDGVNDEFHPNTFHSYLSSSAIEVVFNYTGSIGGLKTIFGYRHNGGYSSPTIGSIYLSDDRLRTSLITYTQVYRQTTSSTVISRDTTYHVVFNKDTSAGTMQVYINGTLDSSQTFDAAAYGQWNVAGAYIGSNDLDIGKSTNTNSGQGWGSDFFAGVMPIAKIYSGTLSANQIQQNYLAYKKRFNI